jgi:hypothetical protein
MIGCDAGSTDPGPGPLATAAVKRDTAIMLIRAIKAWSAKNQSLQRYSRTCSGDSDTANTATRYCAIGFAAEWDLNRAERVLFNKQGFWRTS